MFALARLCIGGVVALRLLVPIPLEEFPWSLFDYAEVLLYLAWDAKAVSNLVINC